MLNSKVTDDIPGRTRLSQASRRVAIGSRLRQSNHWFQMTRKTLT